MAKFTIEYKHVKNYEEGIKLEISMAVRPTKDDYQKILDAMATLDEMKKYINIEDKKENN